VIDKFRLNVQLHSWPNLFVQFRGAGGAGFQVLVEILSTTYA